MLVVVDVPEKLVERRDSLDEPRLDQPPLIRGNDAGYRVHRPHPLDPFFRAVDRETHAILPHGEVQHGLSAAELLSRRLPEAICQPRVMATRLQPLVEHFVERGSSFVALEESVVVMLKSHRVGTMGRGRNHTGNHRRSILYCA